MKNKKLLLLIIVLVIIMFLSFFLILKNNENKSKENPDAIKFKEEYESLNNDNYKKISISSDNPIVYSSYEEIEKIIKEGSGIIYLGFPECPWCRNAVPVLFDAARESGITNIYYFNALSIRDQKHLDSDGNIVVDKEGSKEYHELVNLLYDYLQSYDGLNDNTIKRIYFPSVIFVKDGNILGLHTSTVESQTNPNIDLTKEQYQELKEIYVEYMLKVLGSICSDDIEQKC